jgi:hypothetical protein
MLPTPWQLLGSHQTVWGGAIWEGLCLESPRKPTLLDKTLSPGSFHSDSPYGNCLPHSSISHFLLSSSSSRFFCCT